MTGAPDVRALAARVREADEASREVVDAVLLRVLDLVGSACAGHRLGTWRALAAALDTPGPVRTWFGGDPRGVADALRLHAFMSHAAYMEDGSRSTGGHPSCVATTTALTVAAAMGASPGRPSPKDLVAAIAFGYDVFLRVGERAYPAIVERGFQSTAVLAPLAAAAVCARLLRLDEERIAHALAIAASQGAGLKAALRASASQPLQVANGCEAGRVAARMAGDGARGHPEILAEGFYPAYAGSARELPEPARPRVLDTYVKLHGGCRGNHAPLDAFRDLVARHGLGADAIRSVTVHVDRYTLAADVEHPRNAEQAQFSIPYALAVAATHGETSAFAFTARRLADEAVRALMARIAVHHDPALDADYPARRAARVEIATDAGKLEARIEHPLGEPENPVTGGAIVAKYTELARPVLGGDSGRVADLVLALDRQPSIDPLVELLCRSRAPGDGLAAR